MLRICNDPLPRSEACYIAFRLACCDTLERMLLAEQVGDSQDRPFGFLTEVPFLKLVPPHVQIDLLVETWDKHRREELVAGSLVDESVVYAVCETASRLVLSDAGAAERVLRTGPREVTTTPNLALNRQIQALHLDLSNEGDFLLISQFQDIPPDEARVLKRKFGLDDDACEPMFDALGRWRIAASFPMRAAGLLTPVETSRALELFQLHGAWPKLPEEQLQR